ncbi:MAG: hypothetical protein Q9170_002607 [Blastenia crenularia]
MWLKWEKGEKGWQKRVTAYGNRLFAKIPHEEWGLKSIPPLSKRREDQELLGKKDVTVVYPRSVISEEGVQEALKKYGGDERQGFHSKWLWGSIIGMPISAPVALVPVLDVRTKELDSEVEGLLQKSPGGHPKSTSPDAERMLLAQSSGKLIADLVEVPELEEHIQRAVKQVEKALSAQRELKEEEELDKSNQEADPKR